MYDSQSQPDRFLTNTSIFLKKTSNKYVVPNYYKCYLKGGNGAFVGDYFLLRMNPELLL